MSIAGINNDFLDMATLAGIGFARVGRGVLVHPLAVVHGAQHISLGDRVRIDAFAVLSAGAPMSLGDYTHVGSHASVLAARPVMLGEFCNLSHGVVLLTTTDDFQGSALLGAMVPLEYRRPLCEPVTLVRHVNVGANSVILPGVTAQEGAAVGALSLVKHDLAPWTLYAGVPARALRERSRAALLFADQLRVQPSA